MKLDVSIELSLSQRLKDKFNAEVQELIELEVRIDGIKNLTKEVYIKYCEILNARKTELMNSLSLQQKQLDEYINYLPKGFR